MKFLRKQLDAVRPQFEQGGRFEKLYYLYDALDTFAFVPGHTTHGGVHIRDGVDLKRTMFIVVVALGPALLFGMWNVGHQHYVAIGEMTGLMEGLFDKLLYGSLITIPIVLVSYTAGGIVEVIFAIARKHSVQEGFLVSGMLIPLVMPPTVPLWMVALATVFAVVVAKEAFGGTGMNVLNVALTARVFLFFAYPTYMAGDAVWVAGDPEQFVDGYSGATPLGVAYLEGLEGLKNAAFHDYSLLSMAIGTIPGSIGETSALMVLMGAGLLIAVNVADWRIILSVLVGGFLTAGVLYAVNIDPFNGVPPHYHMVMGSILFAAVFMATDPVTAASTTMGKWIYGFLIGVFGIIIRVLNPAYPEGWMLAILLMNVFAPTID
ncbi:MAG: NADH:ubiquinone reductase (Na(+)-transporting) subunit B, partial [Bacteroidota bacterium]